MVPAVKSSTVLPFIFCVLILFTPGVACPQDSENPDDYSLLQKIGYATGETLLSNATVWALDFALLQPYAFVSLESWKRNLQGNWQWDDNEFFTNQILHPYQGSFYFNSARTNGLSFWQSVPFTMFGSATWEMFGERGLPSMNDFITTTFGGVAIGETSYRLASALVTNKPAGFRGVLRETAAAIINPVQCVNRYLFGKTLPSSAPGRPERYSLDTLTGVALTGATPEAMTDQAYALLGFGFAYGDPYDQEGFFDPYDYFDFDLDVAANLENPTWDVFGQAILVGHSLFFGDDIRAVAGIFQHFDYLQNSVYKFASNGIGAGLQARVRFGELCELKPRLHVYGVALSGLDSSYSKEQEGRNWSYGQGFGVKSELTFSVSGIGILSVLYNHYFFYTMVGADTWNQVSMLSISNEYVVTESLRVGIGLSCYDRWSDAAVNDSSSYAVRAYLVHSI